MKIQNHILTAPADTVERSPNMGGTITPTIIVLHYTASGGEDGEGDADYLSRASSRASAQVVVGRKGDIHQIIPFNKKAWHAGVSKYGNRENVNDFSIGIEIDNWGWLTNGKSHAGVTVPENLRFKGTRSGKSEWEAYPDAQLDAVEQVIAAICDEYDITDIVGHEDIAPGRKQDPGPALDEFKRKMKEKYVDKKTETNSESKPSAPKADESSATVSASSLRLRSRPTTSSVVLTNLSRGRKVQVLEKKIPGHPGWSKVSAGGRTGYVANQYLT